MGKTNEAQYKKLLSDRGDVAKLHRKLQITGEEFRKSFDSFIPYLEWWRTRYYNKVKNTCIEAFNGEFPQSVFHEWYTKSDEEKETCDAYYAPKKCVEAEPDSVQAEIVQLTRVIPPQPSQVDFADAVDEYVDRNERITKKINWNTMAYEFATKENVLNDLQEICPPRESSKHNLEIPVVATQAGGSKTPFGVGSSFSVGELGIVTDVVLGDNRVKAVIKWLKGNSSKTTWFERFRLCTKRESDAYTKRVGLDEFIKRQTQPLSMTKKDFTSDATLVSLRKALRDLQGKGVINWHGRAHDDAIHLGESKLREAEKHHNYTKMHDDCVKSFNQEMGEIQKLLTPDIFQLVRVPNPYLANTRRRMLRLSAGHADAQTLS